MANFHRKPFDEGTLTKLELFEKYAQAWLPVFLARSTHAGTITVADFFAGPGHDADGKPGSPLRLLKQIRQYTESITSSNARVRLELNEAASSKARSLQSVMLAQSIPNELCSWTVHNLEFEQAFEKFYPRFRDSANLIFLDQQGMKFISDDVFLRMTALPRTDFIFFIASSFIRRFEEHAHFRRYLAIPTGTISARSFNDTHRAVTEYYRNLLRGGNDYFIGQFSIKKGSNLYGLIFGSGHPSGIEKFLRVCWAMDPERGEANFDIDHDHIDPTAPHLFPEMDVARKASVFQEELRGMILNRVITTDADAYVHCLRRGMLPKHGKEVVGDLRRQRNISVEGGRQPRISLKGYKDPRRLEVTNNGNV